MALKWIDGVQLDGKWYSRAFIPNKDQYRCMVLLKEGLQERRTIVQRKLNGMHRLAGIEITEVLAWRPFTVEERLA